jgi:hypothetical protein
MTTTLTDPMPAFARPAASASAAADPPGPGFAIPEAARRRPEFDATGNWLTLGDGQDWCLPRPRVRFVRERTEVGFSTRVRFDPTFDALNARLDEERGEGFVRLALEIGEYLLLRNYDLSLAEVQELIYWEAGGPTGGPIMEAVLDTAMGFNTPKPSAAG